MESQLRRPNGCVSEILERKYGKGLMSEKVITEDASELMESAHAVDFRDSRVTVSKSKTESRRGSQLAMTIDLHHMHLNTHTHVQEKIHLRRMSLSILPCPGN